MDWWRIGLCLGLAAAAWAGCKTTPKPLPPLTTETVEETQPIASPEPLTAQPARADVEVGPPGKVPRVETNEVERWIPLERWSQANGLGQPVQLAAGTNLVFELRTALGAIAIKVGSRMARCHEVECWLGYGPQIIQGLPYIHAIDAEKTLAPLVSPSKVQVPARGTIVIDPGHGGRDCGTTSVVESNCEKEYALDWGLRLVALLSSNGWQVHLTRTNDVEVALSDRVALAERVKADLFLSLHFNSGLSNRELAGIETYCLTPTGLPSTLQRSYEDDVKSAYPNNAFDEENFLWALRLHRSLLRGTNASDRGVRRARFMGVLRGQNRPAVLIEAGYLSNLSEATHIHSAAYREALAAAVADALR